MNCSAICAVVAIALLETTAGALGQAVATFTLTSGDEESSNNLNQPFLLGVMPSDVQESIQDYRRYVQKSQWEKAFKQLEKLGGADAIVSTAATPKPLTEALASLRPAGRLVLVGLPEDNVFPLPIFETVLRGIQVIGSLVGTREDLAEVFELHAGGRTRVVLEPRELEAVNECFADVLAGIVPARLVFDLR